MGWSTALIDRSPAVRRSAGSLIACTLGTWVLMLFAAGEGNAQTGFNDARDERIDLLEQTVRSLVEENRRLGEAHTRLSEQFSDFAEQSPPPIPAAEAWTPFEDQRASGAAPLSQGPWLRTGYVVDYDGGFVIRAEDLDDSPFSLRINSQTTFRYSGFAADVDEWIDSAGNVTPITSTSDFVIPRGRVILSGRAVLPNLTYLVNVDYNTATNNPIGFRAYALNFEIDRAFTISVGQNKVPGSREWLGSAFVAMEGPDRSMATTFFRPSLSQGIWFTGEPREGLFYHAMLSNGFNTLNLRPSQLDNRIATSGSIWWDPLGPFGSGYADLEAHDELATRIGGSATFSVEQGSQANNNAPENSSIRLSDGTLITLPGAFAPGVTLQRFDISLLAVDAAIKYRGFSLSTEWYFQKLFALQGNGPLPLSSTTAYGGVLQGGYFVIPQEVELYARTSHVTGNYGTGSEYAGGVNWFIVPGRNNLRFTFDLNWLNNSPADQNRTGFVAGQTGLLLRTQITASF